MVFRLLLDEMTEASLSEYCGELGHDVERVVEEPELGRGTSDTVVAEYAENQGRLLVTYDSDFLTDTAAQRKIGVLYQPDDRTPPFETAKVIDAVEEHLEQRQVVDNSGAIHLTSRWL